MNVIILAAGSGNRMGKYTQGKPKCMLELGGKTLLNHQLDALRSEGMENISVVTGYKSDCVNVAGLKHFRNKEFANTNMVETLMCAREELQGEVLIAYADIIYSPDLIRILAKSSVDIGVLGDSNWRPYWKLRYGDTEQDLESFQVADDMRIVELGRPATSSVGIDYRYIGLIRLSALGSRQLLTTYDAVKKQGQKWPMSGNPFAQGYMTDLLHAITLQGHNVHAVDCRGGWVELDTETDYEKTVGWLKDETLSKLGLAL